MPITSSNVVAISSAFPGSKLNNQQLTKFLNLPADWIFENFGVSERKIVSGKEDAFSLAAMAANQVLKISNYDKDNLDLIVVATATAEYQFPTISCLIKDHLGIQHGYGIDLAGAGGGFIAALNIANNAILLQQAKSALIIGVDTFTKVVNWENPISTLFGDGAGALILEASDKKSIIDIKLKTTAEHNSLFKLVNSNTSAQNPIVGLEEKNFIKAATTLLIDMVLKVLEQHNLQISDLAWIVPQQVHIKVLHNLIKHFDLNTAKVILTLSEHGNTGSAAILLALEAGIRSGLLQKGDRILLLEISSGLTVGAALMTCHQDWINLK